MLEVEITNKETGATKIIPFRVYHYRNTEAHNTGFGPFTRREVNYSQDGGATFMVYGTCQMIMSRCRPDEKYNRKIGILNCLEKLVWRNFGKQFKIVSYDNNPLFNSLGRIGIVISDGDTQKADWISSPIRTHNIYAGES